jgi:hypothetical protein
MTAIITLLTMISSTLISPTAGCRFRVCSILVSHLNINIREIMVNSWYIPDLIGDKWCRAYPTVREMFTSIITYKSCLPRVTRLIWGGINILQPVSGLGTSFFKSLCFRLSITTKRAHSWSSFRTSWDHLPPAPFKQNLNLFRADSTIISNKQTLRTI